jgi:hypothetical protein
MSVETMRTESVCLNENRDPRVVLVKDKYFSLRPKPLERWLWQRGVPQAAERVFWLHWEEGMKSRDWCSQLSLSCVASRCCVDPSTVTRAYQVLKTLGLIRREDPGRDPANPFQQATAVTEVRVPRELLVELSRSPNRPSARSARPEPKPEAAPVAPIVELPAVSLTPHHPTRREAQAMWSRASTGEKDRYYQASRNGVRRIDFDSDTRLTAEERGRMLAQLEQMVRARVAPAPAAKSVQQTVYAGPRKLSVLELARTRKRITETVPGPEVAEVLRQVIWAAEEGALRRFELPLAVNIALKKIREGCWTRPNRMPPNWLRAHASQAAGPETCSAA